MNHYFTDKILDWHKGTDREMPWKGEKNPYLVWLSEIILQQTRVEQGLPYFLKFKEKFPDVASLAKAKEDEVLKLWQGLGYYSRARNLHAAARYIHHDLGGKFPADYEGLRQLKGVGDYTAAAIASFAYNQPYAVVDGNVFRVLSRFFGIHTPIDTTEGKKQFRKLADQLISKNNPGGYNQAIMDFGALQCVPKKPDCHICPLRKKCKALIEGTVEMVPVKSKKIKLRTRHFHYLVINDGLHLYLSKRTGKDIWKNLYELPLVESEKPLAENELKETEQWKSLFRKGEIREITFSGSYWQILTHQKIHASFYEVRIKKNVKLPGIRLLKTRLEFLNNFAFPKIIDLFFKEKMLYSTVN